MEAEGAGEAEAEEPAGEIAAEFVLNVCRHGSLGVSPLESALEVGWGKQQYTICGTARFATSRSQGSEAEQTNRRYREAVAGQAVPAACGEHPGHGLGRLGENPRRRHEKRYSACWR